MPRLKPDQTSLTGAPFREFRDALISAYPGRTGTEKFEQMFTLYLGRDLARITNPLNNIDAIAFQAIQTADAQGWSRELLLGAIQGSEGNPDLLNIAYDYGLSAVVFEQKRDPVSNQRVDQRVDRLSLQAVVSVNNPFIDGMKFRDKMARLEEQVCRIEHVDGTPWGTGFLLGSNVVITNYHVMKFLNRGLVEPNQVVFRFGYKKTSDGIQLYGGTLYSLAANWRIDESPMNIEEEGGHEGQPTPEELDYSLLRVNGAPGNDMVGAAQGLAQSSEREFIKMPSPPRELTAGAPLYILQHPKGEPAQWASDSSPDNVEVRNDGLRVRYKTNTRNGSSGSPCFTANFDLVALHHMGDQSDDHPAAFNQGIPMPKIMQLLAARGHMAKIGRRELV